MPPSAEAARADNRMPHAIAAPADIFLSNLIKILRVSHCVVIVPQTPIN
jgi:hypothetical protein